MGAHESVKDRKCPLCNRIAFKANGTLADGIRVWGSVHSKCIHCESEIVCGWGDKRYVLISQEYFNELERDRQMKSFDPCI